MMLFPEPFSGKEKHVCVHSEPFYGVQRGSAGIRQAIFFNRKTV